MIDPNALARNVAQAWRRRDSTVDAVKRLCWVYSNKLPARLKKLEWLIGFRYPRPIGTIRLRLRANAGSDSFIHGEVFEHGYYDLGLTEAPATILDLGANIGLTTIYFARRYPNAKIASVEPVQSNLRLLRENIALNKVSGTVIAGAVDAADGRIAMDTGYRDLGHRVLTDGPAKGALVEVDGYSLPTLMARLGWDRIGLLKIDIEGHEKTLLASCYDWIDRVDAICIECHDGFGEADLTALARRYGFRPPELLPGIWLLRR